MMEDDIEDISPTDFMIRMLSDENMDGVAQILVYKRWDTGEIGWETFAMRDVDVLGAAKYIDIAATLDARAALSDAMGGDEED